MKKSKILIAALTAGSLFGMTALTAPWVVSGPGMPTAFPVAAQTGEPAATATENSDPIVAAHAPTITAKAAFLLEANSGKILYAKDADARLPIASMTKIATLGVIYDALAQGTLTMDELILVSDNAASMGGSQAFLDAGSEYQVRALIQSIVVASANDSCVALAERLAGSVAAFVEQMNAFAKRVGCTNTNFVNCTGLPTPGAYSSAHDLSLMYQALMQSPHFGDFNHVWMYDFNHPSGRVTGLTNTNKLIRNYQGCLGGKTGFTNEAGHCLTVAAERGDLKPIAVIIGAADSKTRFNESRTLLDYAFNSFENQLIVDQEQPIKHVTVKNAVQSAIDLYPATNYYHLTPKGQKPNLTVATEIPDAISAPVQPTDAVGTIYILQDGKVLQEIPAQTNQAIPAASYWDTVQKVVHGSQL